MEPENLTSDEGVSGNAGGGWRRWLIVAGASALGLVLLVGVGLLWLRPLGPGQVPVNAEEAPVQTTGTPPEAPVQTTKTLPEAPAQTTETLPEASDQDGPTAAAEEVGFSPMDGAGDGAGDGPAEVSMSDGEQELMTRGLDEARHVLGNRGAPVTVIEFSDFL